ncbi:MAG: hypothetical protein AAF390_01180 [Pseudomonadota bacterium]
MTQRCTHTRPIDRPGNDWAPYTSCLYRQARERGIVGASGLSAAELACLLER